MLEEGRPVATQLENLNSDPTINAVRCKHFKCHDEQVDRHNAVKESKKSNTDWCEDLTLPEGYSRHHYKFLI